MGLRVTIFILLISCHYLFIPNLLNAQLLTWKLFRYYRNEQVTSPMMTIITDAHSFTEFIVNTNLEYVKTC